MPSRSKNQIKERSTANANSDSQTGFRTQNRFQTEGIEKHGAGEQIVN